MDDLKLSRANYFGYSMGGWIGFGLAKYLPDRFDSLILGEAHPYAEDMQAFRDLMPREPTAFLALPERAFGPHRTPAILADLMANDLDVLLALTQDRTSHAEVLPTMSMPCLLFSGETDPRLPRVQECLQGLVNGTFFSLPACDHVAAIVRGDLVLPYMIAFLGKVSS